MNKDQLVKIAQAMVADGKGLLAADEGTSSIKKRFDAIKVENTETNRRDYREFMFRTAEAMQRDIYGVILFDETIRQTAADGTPLVKLIENAGVIPGIKVDTSPVPMAGFPGEVVTSGIDGLAGRLAEYYGFGARFAKWRAVIDIGRDIPTLANIRANTHLLARYAALCQEANIVPIVEPEVLMDGDHSIDRCFEVTELVLKTLYAEMYEARVLLEGSILKPNMVVPGKKCAHQATPDQVAEQTIRVFNRCVPAAVPGIMFLSGGQSDIEATANLDAINKRGPHPWKISFSYGRALQSAAQKAWSGNPAHVPAAQKAFAHRAKMNRLAALGQWSEVLETA